MAEQDDVVFTVVDVCLKNRTSPSMVKVESSPADIGLAIQVREQYVLVEGGKCLL